MKNIVISVVLIVSLFSCKGKKDSEIGPETNSAVSEAGDISENSEGDWVQLFDGKTFNGWHTYMSDSISDQWKIEDGILYYEPDPDKNQGVNNLVTDKKFESFELSLEWKISVDGNSGIFYGILEDEKYVVPYMTAPEIQIRDYTNIPDFSDHKQMSGAIFGIVGPEKDVAGKAGEWNRFLIRIDHKKNEGTVVLNGEEIISYPVNGAEWGSLVENSKFKGWEDFGIRRSGSIGLQDHAHGVWFRNIRIREL